MEGYKLLNSTHWAFDVYYELDKTSSLPKGNIIVGKRGLHFCADPHLLLMFKRYQPDLLFCKVKAFGSKIVEKNGIYATDQLMVVEENHIDELWKNHSREILESYHKSDDLMKEQLLTFICHWDETFVKSIELQKLQFWAMLCRGDISEFDDCTIQTLIPQFSYFCYLKQHHNIVEKYYNIINFNVWIAKWDVDFIRWFLNNVKRLQKIESIVSFPSFAQELFQMEIEQVNAWCQFFPFLEQKLYQCLKSIKTNIVDHRVVLWLHNKFHYAQMVQIPSKNFGIFSSANKQVMSVLQRYRKLNPTLIDVYELYQKGHFHYFEFFMESFLQNSK
jgi:hypothetical protein